VNDDEILPDHAWSGNIIERGLFVVLVSSAVSRETSRLGFDRRTWLARDWRILVTAGKEREGLVTSLTAQPDETNHLPPHYFTQFLCLVMLLLELPKWSKLDPANAVLIAFCVFGAAKSKTLLKPFGVALENKEKTPGCGCRSRGLTQCPFMPALHTPRTPESHDYNHFSLAM